MRKLSWIFGVLSYLGLGWPFFADAALELDGYEMLGHFVLAFFWIVFSSCLAILFGFLVYRSVPQPRLFRRRIELLMLMGRLASRWFYSL